MIPKDSTPFLDRYRARERRDQRQRDRMVWQASRPDGMGSGGSPKSGAAWRAAANLARNM